MALVKFTDTQNPTRSVLINPDHIIYVQTVKGQTWIATSALNGSGGTRVFIVEEDEQSAGDAISQAQRNVAN